MKYDDDKLLTEVISHYEAWTSDNQTRLTRKGGWNDITDAYYGKLPDDWPFKSRVVDPRIRTALIEKNSRLGVSKLRGRVIPRESSDVLKARIQNAILDFQWDTANEGGSMATKISICDMDTRLYGSKFALVKWKREFDKDGKVVFNGNEFIPLDIRDCGMDFSASHIRNAKWFQHRSWEFLEDLENQTDSEGKPIFKNLGEIKAEIFSKRDLRQYTARKDTAYVSRIKSLRGLEERTGTDIAFPQIEVVTEYRKDIWVTFCPAYKKIIRVIKNPYLHGKIPIVQLRYYPLQDDPLGESEVEPVLPLWKAIQACLCGFLDEVILKMRPPLKIIEGAARIETIVYGPEAQWLVTRPDAVTEASSLGEAIRYFQSSYSALVAAFNTAMGMMSQGISGVDPFNPPKTATEVRASMLQQNARDQKNMQDLIEFIKDVIMMWVSNNRQFLFTDAKQHQYLLRIVGGDNFEYFKRMGLDEMIIPDEVMAEIAQVVQDNPNISEKEIRDLIEAGKIPKYPVFENPKEKNPEKIKVYPKMEVNEMGDSAVLRIVPEDLEGDFDYVADVRSVAMGADAEMQATRQEAIALVTTNQNVIQLLEREGWRPKIKELLVANLEDKGLRDAERFFEKHEQQAKTPPANQEMGGLPPNIPVGGLSQLPQAGAGESSAQPLAGPGELQNLGGISQSV